MLSWNASDLPFQNSDHYDHFFSHRFAHFETLLGWECGFLCHDLRIQKRYLKQKERI